MPDESIWREKHEPAAEIRSLTRAQAIEHGRRLGEETAENLRETGRNREDRIKRAMAYAAWDYDGRPPSSSAQRTEMTVDSADLPGYMERAQMWEKRGEQ